MDWPSFKINRQFFRLMVGLIALILAVFWVFKLRNIQRMRSDIVQIEIKLSKGQEIWRNSPPLPPKEKGDLQRAQERLFRTLPKERDVPAVLQEVSRVAREYNLENLSLNTSGGAPSPIAGQPPTPVAVAPQATVSQPASSAVAKAPEGSEAIGSFPVKLTFAGEYREIAYFLEALQKIPRVITIQSLQLQRGMPLVMAEVVMFAYYQKKELSDKIK